MHLFRSSIFWPDRTRRRLPVLSPPLPRDSRAHEIRELAWKLSRARREVRRRERRENILPSLLRVSLMPASGNIHARSCISCALLSLSSYFVFSYMIPIMNFVPEREFQSEWKPEWLTCAGPKFRLGIMWTDALKCMEMEWTRSGMKFVPVLCKQLQRNVTM